MQETRIRLFTELIQLVLGQPGAVEGLGLLPSTLIVVETDGSIKQLDSLSSAYPGAADTGLHVSTDASTPRSIIRPRSPGRSVPMRCRDSAGPARSCRSAAAAFIRTATGEERASATFGLLCRPDAAHHPRTRPCGHRSAGDVRPRSVGLDLRSEAGPLAAARASGCSAVSVSLVPAKHVGEQRSASA